MPRLKLRTEKSSKHEDFVGFTVLGAIETMPKTLELSLS